LLGERTFQSVSETESMKFFLLCKKIKTKAVIWAKKTAFGMLRPILWTGLNLSFDSIRKWSWKWPTQVVTSTTFYHLEEKVLPVFFPVNASVLSPAEALVYVLFVQVEWSKPEDPDVVRTTNYKIRIPCTFFMRTALPSVAVSLTINERSRDPRSADPILSASSPDFLLTPITEADWNELRVQS
jgi:hypothetical protein